MLYFKVFSKILCRQSSKFAFTRHFKILSSRTAYITEPDYLKYLKPPVPVYELLNIQMKAYDYTILEHYSKHVHKIAVNMDIDVKNAWATPHQALKTTNVDPSGKKVIAEYLLNVYERNIQVKNLHAYSAPLFFEVIQSALPEGVSISIHAHLEEHDNIRYIPDFELISRKEMVVELEKEIDPPAKK